MKDRYQASSHLDQDNPKCWFKPLCNVGNVGTLAMYTCWDMGYYNKLSSCFLVTVVSESPCRVQIYVLLALQPNRDIVVICLKRYPHG